MYEPEEEDTLPILTLYRSFSAASLSRSIGFPIVPFEEVPGIFAGMDAGREFEIVEPDQEEKLEG